MRSVYSQVDLFDTHLCVLHGMVRCEKYLTYLCQAEQKNVCTVQVVQFDV